MGLVDKIFGKKDNKWNKEDLIDAFEGACSKEQWRNAIKYGNELAPICRDTGDKQGEYRCYHDLGSAYANLGDFKKAIEYYKKSSEIAKEYGDRRFESDCYVNLAYAYGKLGNPTKALVYHNKSMKIFGISISEIENLEKRSK